MTLNVNGHVFSKEELCSVEGKHMFVMTVGELSFTSHLGQQ